MTDGRAALAFGAALLLGLVLAATCGRKGPGAKLYSDHCASCHDIGRDPRAPSPASLGAMSGGMILASLESGKMQAQGAALSPAERQVLAAHLAAAGDDVAELPRCGEETRLALDGPVLWSGFSPDPENTRFQPAESAGVGLEEVPHLELLWAHALPGAFAVRAAPAILGGTVFVGSPDGRVYALDRASGCVHWAHPNGAEPRTPLTVGRAAPEGRLRVWFGDGAGWVVALDAASGEAVWRVRVHDHPFAFVTGAPRLHGGALYVPVSSYEVAVAGWPAYDCCTFTGAVVALDAANGAERWRTPMGGPAKPTNEDGDSFGPSGSPVWTSPVIDTARGQLVVGTGENYSTPADAWSDALVALDLATGAVRWRFQATARDAYNVACHIPLHPNCPDEDGPDFDFGASPVLWKSGSDDLLLAGQKSGVVHAVDPEDGGVRWQTRVGRGGTLGGVHWGMALGGDRLFVPVSDREDGRDYPDPPRPGLVALDVRTGEELWYAPVPGACKGREGCFPGLSAAIVAAPGLVVTGGLDGHLRAHRASDGQLLWERDTWGEIPASNGVARGGSIDATVLVLADGMLFAGSGYAPFRQGAGNAFLAFRVRR